MNFRGIVGLVVLQLVSNSDCLEKNELVESLHYAGYLKDVLELVNGDIAANGRIGHKVLSNLGKLAPNVRSELDKLKMTELKRINELVKELSNRNDTPPEHAPQSFQEMSRHLNPKYRLFTSEDLRALLLEANAELAIINNYRREDFLEYEMHKKLEFDELVKRLPEPKRAAILNDEKIAFNIEFAHRKKRPEYLPLAKQYLVKVWEEKDKLDRENFNVKTFFHIHDLNGDGYLDENELKAFMRREFEIGDFKQDEVEREEQVERHIERAFEVGDTNKDHLLDLHEFILSSPGAGYEDSKFWEHLHDMPIFLNEEFDRYAEKHRDEVIKLIDEGKLTLDLKGIVHHEDEKKDEHAEDQQKEHVTH